MQNYALKPMPFTVMQPEFLGEIWTASDLPIFIDLRKAAYASSVLSPGTWENFEDVVCVPTSTSISPGASCSHKVRVPHAWEG